MRHLSNKYRFAVLSLSVIFLLANSGSHPIGNTGAPGDNDCGNCHGGGSFSGNLNVDFFETGNGLQLVTEFDAGVPTTFGWQWTVLDDNDNPIGNWDFLPGNSSIKTNGSGQEWLGHQPAQLYNSGIWGTDGGEWDAQGYCGDVHFYMATLTANGNGNTSGDEVHLDMFTYTLGCGALGGVLGDFSEPTCNGDCDGFIVADGTGGQPPYSFQWSDGQATATATNLCADDYVVTITDQMGDDFILEMTLGEPDELIGEETGLEHAGCFGENLGLIQITTSGGTGSYDYDWEPAGEGCCPDGLFAGTYTVTITDAFGCEFIDSYVIDENPEIELDFTSTVTAPGAATGTAEVIVTGGDPPYEYAWSNGEDTEMISDLGAGTYTVTITDNAFCEAIGSVVVSEGNCAITAIPNIAPITCYGENGTIGLMIMGAVMPIDFFWSDGSNDSTLEAPAGTYSVSLTDDVGCSTIVNGIVLSDPDSLNVTSTTLIGTACPNTATGSLNVQVTGGAGDYTLSWSNGLTNDTLITGMTGMDTTINIQDTLINLAAGYLSYTLTDGSGCTRVDSFLIPSMDMTPPTVSPATLFVYLDENGTTGIVDHNMELYGAGWTDNCGIADITTNVPIGSYSCSDIGSISIDVIVTDVSGNTSNTTALMTIQDTISPTLICPQDFSVTTCGAIDYDTPIVNDNCDNGLTPLLSSGLAPGSQFPVGITGVIYEATDLCGNRGTCSFNVTVENDLDVSFDVMDSQCGLNNGSIIPTIAGGTPPYTIDPPVLEDLAPGTYPIAIADSGGCTLNQMVTVGEEGTLSVDFGPTIFSICPGEVVDLQVTVLSGNAPFTFLVNSNVLTTSSNTVESFTVSSTSTVEVQDADGCSISQQVLVETLMPPPMVVINDIILDCDDPGIDPLTVSLPANVLIMGNPSLLTAGTYNLIYDSTSEPCDWGIAGTFSVIGGADLSLQANVMDSGCATGTGSIDLTITGGTPPYSYAPFGPIQGGLAPGNYTIVVTDAGGCSTSEVITIAQTNGPQLIIEESTICFGATDGRVTLSATGGTPPYRYALGNTGLLDETTDPFAFTNRVAGNYFVQVVDANGCSASGTAVIREHPELTIIGSFRTTGECIYDIDADIIVEVSGGVSPYSITREDLSGVGTGPFFFEVTDGAGCVASSTLNAVGTDLEASITIVQECDGTSTVFPMASGGCPPYDFPMSFVQMAPGTYTLVITDSNNMTDTIVYDILLYEQMVAEVVSVQGNEGTPSIVDINTTGGSAPYQYTWTNAAWDIISTEEDLNAILEVSQDVTVTIQDANGCLTSQVVFVEVPVATVDLDKDDQLVGVYPIPAFDRLHINFQDKVADEMSLMTYSGESLKTTQDLEKTNVISLNELSSGVYFVKVKLDGKIIMKRFIKL